jgi:hypothetical protein
VHAEQDDSLYLHIDKWNLVCTLNHSCCYLYGALGKDLRHNIAETNIQSACRDVQFDIINKVES